MRTRALALLVLGGCAFRPDGDAAVVADAAGDDAVDVDAATSDAAMSDAAMSDARPIDAAMTDARPIDAPPLPIDAGGPILLETLMIPAGGQVVTSTRPLAFAVRYTLRVSGDVVIASNGAHGDAEYWDYDVGGAAMDLAGGTVDIGVGINDTVVDADKSPDWGPYQASHIYTTMFTGLGQPITASYHDGNPGNNSGNLVLEIYSP